MSKYIIISFLLVPNLLFSQAPGNIGSGLHLWLNANTGVTLTGNQVTSWINQAPTAMTNQASKTATPNVTLISGDINYNSTLFFDGTSAQNLQGLYTTTPQIAPLMFSVVKKNGSTASCCLNPYSLGPAGCAGLAYGTGAPNSYSLDGSGFGCSNTINGANKLGIVRADYQFINNTLDGFTAFNGTTNPVCGAGSVNMPNGTFQVGGRTFGGISSRIFNGRIAELIHYNSNVITALEVQKIESYLAIKYGITLSNNYLNSSSTLIYNTNTYNNDIIGISRDDNSSQLQKQSHQEDDSTRLYLSSLTGTNLSNLGTFTTDNQHLVMGHNNDALVNLGSIEVPPGLNIFSRIDREWKITNTNYDGTYSIDLKLNTSQITHADIKILIDDDGDFTNATIHSPTIQYSGNVLTISGLSTSEIPINTTRYLTLISMKYTTPLPVNTLSFIAKPLENQYISLEWITASEINNDYFTIERSLNGYDWEEVNKIDGAGNSMNYLNYNSRDNHPYIGTSYYRLKQTDFDGQYEYSQIQKVKLLKTKHIDIKIHPNPTNNSITIIGDFSELSIIHIFNALGQDVTNYTSKEHSNEKIIIDLSNLSNGIYYIMTKNSSNKVFKQ